MLKTISSIVIILHGLVHIWYLLLMSKVVKYQPDMGWTGASWLLPGSPENAVIRISGILLYGLASLLFIISGISLMAGSSITVRLLIISALLSSLLILVFFDGQFNMLVQKGLIGLIINLVIIVFAFSIQPD